MAKYIAVAAGAGVLSASLMMALLAGSLGNMVLAYMTPLPLFYVGLVYGAGGAVLAGLAGTAASMIVGPLAAVGYFVVFAFPIAILIRQATLWRARPDGSREYYSPGLLAIWLAGLAGAGLALAWALTWDVEGGLPAALRPALELAVGMVTPPRESATVTAVAERLAAIMPAIIATSWMLMIVINGALAQGLAARFGHSRVPSPSLARIALPHALAALLAGAAVAAALGGPLGSIGLAVEAIVAVPFFLQGLGVLHAVAYRTQTPRMVLLATYGVLTVFIVAILLVAAIGLIEQWARFRQRLAGRPPRRENE